MSLVNDTTFLVKLPRHLKSRLHELAKQEGITASEYLRRLILLAETVQPPPKKGERQ